MLRFLAQTVPRTKFFSRVYLSPFVFKGLKTRRRSRLKEFAVELHQIDAPDFCRASFGHERANTVEKVTAKKKHQKEDIESEL